MIHTHTHTYTQTHTHTHTHTEVHTHAKHHSSSVPTSSLMISADSSQTRICEDWGSVAGGRRARFVMRRPYYCSLDRRRLVLRMTGRMLTFSDSYVFPVADFSQSDSNWLSAFLADECELSRSDASCCCDWQSIPTCARCAVYSDISYKAIH